MNSKVFGSLVFVLGFLNFGCSGSASGTPPGGHPSGGTNGSGGSGGLPHVVPPRAEPGTCELEAPAFCEEFAQPHDGGRGGQIDENSWSFSRYGHETRQLFVRIPASVEAGYELPPTFCGMPFAGLLMPNDVAVCDGVGADGLLSTQLNEVYDDQGDFAFNSMRIRQLFDFTDREGTITLDVDGKINPFNLGHGWWIELFITDDTAPMPYHESPGVLSYPKNGLGFAFQGLNSCSDAKGGRTGNEISRVFVTKNYQIVHDYPGWELHFDDYEGRCFKTADGQLNRFKFVISQNRAEVWASDYDDAKNVRKIMSIEPLDLNFTRGFVHLQHSAYNARKDGHVTGAQTYRWDNIGFDGPSYAMPRAYEIADNDEPDIDGAGGKLYGYYLSADTWTSIPIHSVDLSDANKATFAFSFFIAVGRGLQYRFNGGPEHTFTVPNYGYTGHILRGFAVDVPIEELVNGENTIELKMAPPQEYNTEIVGNMELTVEAAEEAAE
jgi:hypothetical protein